MAGVVWFGTKQYAQWIPAPAVNVEMSRTGFASRADFLGGGAAVRRSKTSSRTFNFAWNLTSRSAVQPIIDFADGLYGNGLMYYADPFAMDRNALPVWCAAPYMNAYDGPWIANGVRPTLLDNGTSTNGYPIESAIYTLNSAKPTQEVYVPIPPGYTAYIGAHGAVLSGTPLVTVTAYSTASGGPTTNLTLLSKTDAPTNFSVSGDTYRGFSIKLGATTSGTLRLDGLMAQVLPNGAVSPVGGFISGQGTSGMSFVSQPVTTGYSAVMDKVGMTASLAETEAWSWQ